MYDDSLHATDTPTSIFTPGKRRRLNGFAVAINAVVPVIVFTVLFYVMSFEYHYERPMLTYAIVLLALLIALCINLYARAIRSRDREATWYNFAAVAIAAAVIASTVAGYLNFWYNMQPYYDVDNLNTYPSVDPSVQRGVEVMDAGRVYFRSGTRLDPTKSMGFKNLDLYCVAPIIVEDAPSMVYDFWAVGINCCSGQTPDFRCGQYANPRARSGLRLMREDQRAFYRLAVQQAEAAYKITASHPVFFYWLQDPVAEMESWKEKGRRNFMIGVLACSVFNLFAVICATIGFSKIGRFTW
mmetsp:Transcript_36753/g.80326  ORF Transcript_36753/g.80326 Transcript_36753/m.80326 type:complete len:299 (-) Transcript_36753:70-966(-)